MVPSLPLFFRWISSVSSLCNRKVSTNSRRSFLCTEYTHSRSIYSNGCKHIVIKRLRPVLITSLTGITQSDNLFSFWIWEMAPIPQLFALVCRIVFLLFLWELTKWENITLWYVVEICNLLDVFRTVYNKTRKESNELAERHDSSLITLE